MLRHLCQYIQRLWVHVFYEDAQSYQARRRQAEQHAADVIRCLRDGQWEDLQSRFILPLRYLISAAFLEKGWTTITASTGSLKREAVPMATVGWFGCTAKVPLQFSRSIRLTMALQMTRSGKLYGLQLGPYMTAPWSPPAYAGTNVRTERLVLGSGLARVNAELTLPSETSKSGRLPCIILIGGSGPVDKDSTIGPLKPFKDLAMGLADGGVAICRFDKVTSTLIAKLWYRKSRITLTDEYVHHVTSAIIKARQHPNVDADRIILLGHSLGALIAAKVASLDSRIAGCILMAAPAEPMYRCAIRQMRYMASLDEDGYTDSAAIGNDNETIEALKKQSDLADSPNLNLSTPASQLPFGIGPAYWLEYRNYNTMDTLDQIGKPVLILQGGRDYQVTVEDDYSQFEDRFSDREGFSFRQFDTLNHLFVPGTGTGKSTPAEYDEPGNVDAAVVDHISQWATGLGRI